MRWLPSFLVVHRWCPKTNPQDLVPIGESRDRKLIHSARRETVDAFGRMADAAKTAGIGLHVIWAYRSEQLQSEQFEAAERKYGRGKGIRWLAPPGFSEHQTGWVLDIGDEADPEADDNPLFERTKAFHWLQGNAARFGFELSFPSDNWQGVGYEPWHWRFVGTSEARRTFHPAGARALQIWARSWREALWRSCCMLKSN